MAAPKPDYIDVTATDNDHNGLAQRHVILNIDEPLVHHHKHLHHDVNAEKGRKDEVVYSKDTSTENSTIPQSPHPQPRDFSGGKHADVTAGGSLETKDVEKLDLGAIDSEEEPQAHTCKPKSGVFLGYSVPFLEL